MEKKNINPNILKRKKMNLVMIKFMSIVVIILKREKKEILGMLLIYLIMKVKCCFFLFFFYLKIFLKIIDKCKEKKI